LQPTMTSFMPFRRWSGSVRILLVLPILTSEFQAFAPDGPNGQALSQEIEQLSSLAGTNDFCRSASWHTMP